MKKTILATLITACCIPISSQAGWIIGLTPKSVRAIGPLGEAAFQTVEPITNPNNCGNSEFYGVRVENNPNMLLSVLLAAYMGGKKIDIFVEETRCDAAGRPSVDNVRIRD